MNVILVSDLYSTEMVNVISIVKLEIFYSILIPDI